MINVQSIQSPAFKGLDFTNVTVFDRENYVKKDLKILKELGTLYDIRLTSTYSDVPDFSAIDIDVKPLKEGLNFFERLFCPTGRATFKTGYVHIDEPLKPSITGSVNIAIKDLVKKIHK